MKLSVILVNYNTLELSITCLQFLYASAGSLNLQVIYIDNASNTDAITPLKSLYPDITYIQNKQNVGFGRANNQALPLLTGEYVLLLNTDAFVEQTSLESTIRYMEENPHVGIAGAKLKGRDGELQPSARNFPTVWNIFLQRTGLDRCFKSVKLIDDPYWNHELASACDWVPGCYFMIRRQVIDQLGLFDPRFFLYYEEVDHCFSAKKAGWEVHYFPGTTVIHIGGESAKSVGEINNAGRQLDFLQIESELLFIRKNYGFMHVWLHMLLSFMAILINIIKALIKGSLSATKFMNNANQIKLQWSIFIQSKMGREPIH